MSTAPLQFIAAINPDLHCARIIEERGHRRELLSEVKAAVAAKDLLAAAALATPRESDPLDLELPSLLDPFDLEGVEHPLERHVLVQDALGESLAPTYFWLLDLLPELCPHFERIETLRDNLSPAPGSGLFTDVTRQATALQDRALKLLTTARQTVERIIATLEEFRGLERRMADPSWTTAAGASPSRLEDLRARLRQDVTSARLYARWLKPYLRAASRLEPRQESHPALVSGFNTVLLEVALLVEDRYEPQEDVDLGLLPKAMLRSHRRAYYSVLLVEINFRGIPERLKQGGYLYRGRTELTITSLSLNEDELRVLRQLVEQDNLGDLLRAVTNETDIELERLQAELNRVSEGKEAPAPTPAVAEDTNPFTALFSFFRSSPTPEATPGAGDLQPDSDIERVFRNQAILRAHRLGRTLYDRIKAAKGMASYPEDG